MLETSWEAKAEKNQEQSMKNGVFFSEGFQEGILIDFGVDFGNDPAKRRKIRSQKALGGLWESS